MRNDSARDTRAYEEGRCTFITSETRLGSAWSICDKPADWRVVTTGESRTKHCFCAKHYRQAKRRTRWGRIVSAEKIATIGSG